MTPEAITAEPTSPVSSLVMRQQWNHLTSLHWPYPVDEVQRLLPDGLVVDAFDGSAWVGLIPFALENIAFGKQLPRVPYFGTFPEVNVRTYVIDPQGRRSIWFFSLDINRAPPTAVARARYGLPYCWGKASIDRGDPTQYAFRRRWPRSPEAHVNIVVVPGARIEVGDVTDFEHFITARWGMSTQVRGKLLYGEVWHPRWPLQQADLVSCDETVVAAAGLTPPTGDPYVLFSPGVDVHIGPLAPAHRLQ